MMYMERPAPIVFGTFKITFDDFVRYLLNTDDRFNRTGAQIRAAMKVENALEKHHGKILELDETLWKVLNEAAEAPTSGYQVLVSKEDPTLRLNTGRQCLVFVDAIAEAKDVPPEKPSEVPGEQPIAQA